VVAIGWKRLVVAGSVGCRELRKDAQVWMACDRVTQAPRATAIGVDADSHVATPDRSDAHLGMPAQRRAATDAVNLHSAVTR